MNEFRKNLIIEAFKKMDRDGSGDLTVQNIINILKVERYIRSI